jgi:hypothetical protein
MDRSDPAVQAVVSALKARLAGPGSGFVARTFVPFLLPAALPKSVAVVLASDRITGETAILELADVDRLSRLMRLFGGMADGLLLRGGPVAKERADGRRFAYRADKSGGFSPSAYVVIDNTLVMGTGIDALKQCTDGYRSADARDGPVSGLASRMAQSLGERDAMLYVDNSGGGMSRMVGAASEKYSFAAFPSIDAVSSISARIKLLPDTMTGSASFACSRPDMIESVLSDVKFLYGAVKRVARASGVNMSGEVSVDGSAVLFNFEIPGYIKLLEGDKE